MKKFIPAIFFIAAFASCKNDSKDTGRDIQLLTDSTVYTNNNVYSDTTATVKNEVAPAPAKAAVATNYTKNKRVIRQAAPTRNVAVAPAPVVTPPVATPPIVNTTPAPETSTAGNGTIDAGKGNGQSKNATASVPEAQQKKGMSKAAQGAIIGGVGGAVGGAILSKKKGLGAIVGAVVGAAGGYIIGKNKDKKDQSSNQYSDYKIQ
ncbi:MAG: YMGG-like glycine zipper-containing protein [Ginsengibacter sp.]